MVEGFHQHWEESIKNINPKTKGDVIIQENANSNWECSKWSKIAQNQNWEGIND